MTTPNPTVMTGDSTLDVGEPAADTAPHIALIHELLHHLDWCGWGDSWERECSEELRDWAAAWQKANPHPASPPPVVHDLSEFAIAGIAAKDVLR